MGRTAFLVTADWPRSRLTNLGLWTDSLTCGGLDHVGIFIPCCTNSEIKNHSDPAISHKSARGAEHVTLDFAKTKVPLFQSHDNLAFWTPDARITCYPITNVDASIIHRVCVEVARRKPYNHAWYRLNRLLCCGQCPSACFCSPRNVVAPSHCAALSMRVIAAARAEGREPLYDDDSVYRALGIDQVACMPPSLTGLTPDAVVRLLRDVRAIGEPSDGFGHAIAHCDANVPVPLVALRT